MGTIRNKFRSRAHKAYNKEKVEYQYWEHKIIEYKQGLFGNDSKFIEEFRRKLKLSVVRLKAFKHEMSARNKEYNKENS